MVFETTFEVGEKGFVWWPSFLALLFSVLSFLLARHHRKGRETRHVVFYAMSAVGLLLAIATFSLTYPEYRELMTAYQRGDFLVVEGPVEDFHPMPPQGHDRETFQVQGIRFAYSDFEYTPGFNRTSSHGGPIKEGVWVRISYYDQPYRQRAILKLEIRK